MVAKFFYKGPRRSIGFRYSGPPWLFLVAVIILGLVLLGVIVVKTLVEFKGALLCFIC